jgi:hypothetical protein
MKIDPIKTKTSSRITIKKNPVRTVTNQNPRGRGAMTVALQRGKVTPGQRNKATGYSLPKANNGKPQSAEVRLYGKPKSSSSGVTNRLVSQYEYDLMMNENSRRQSANYRKAAQAKVQTKRGATAARLDKKSGDSPGAKFYSTNKNFAKGYNTVVKKTNAAKKAK